MKTIANVENAIVSVIEPIVLSYEDLAEDEYDDVLIDIDNNTKELEFTNLEEAKKFVAECNKCDIIDGVQYKTYLVNENPRFGKFHVIRYPLMYKVINEDGVRII